MSLRLLDKEKMALGFWVGAFFVEPQANRLTKDGTVVSMEPKVMQVLVCLAQRPGRTVSKEQFMERVWADTVVTDDALLRCISALRKAFGDDSQSPEYVETIRTQGYRLIAPIGFERPGDVNEQAEAAPPDDWEEAEEEMLLWPLILRRLRHASQSSSVWGVALAGLGLLAAGLLTLLDLTYFSSSSLPAPLQTTPLTSYRGEEVDPSLSPDGKRVAFAWNEGERNHPFNLFVKEVGTETALQVTDHPKEDRSPVWSPDGRQLAFLRSGPEGSRIMLVSAVGGRPRTLKTLTTRDARGLTWSPDGNELAYAAHSGPYEPFSIFLFSLETLEERRLTHPPQDVQGDLDPSFSPDGSQVAFVHNIIENVADVFVVSRRGGSAERLTADNAAISGLTWAPDGQHVIVASDRAGPSSLWRIPVSGGSARWMASLRNGALHHPHVTYGKGQMVLTQHTSTTNIWELPLNVSDSLRRLVVASTRWDANPDISPDGRHITFASQRSGHHEIWMTDRDGTHPVRLTRFEGHVTDTPRWSPDGRQIAFTSRQRGSADIYLVSAAGGTPRRLTDSGSNDKAPHWSQDGQWIYFASNRSGQWETWKMPSDGGKPVQLTYEGGFVAQESPDGTTFYYVRRDAPGIWHAGDGSAERVIDDLHPSDWGNWRVTPQALYYVHRSGAPSIIRYDLQTEQRQTVATLQHLPRRPSLAVMPDGSALFIAQEDRRESDIMIAPTLHN